MEVDVYDPWADPNEVKHEYGIKTMTEYPEGATLSLRCPERAAVEGSVAVEGSNVGYGAIILAVAHNEFRSINLQEHKDGGCIIYDVKGILNPAVTDGRL